MIEEGKIIQVKITSGHALAWYDGKVGQIFDVYEKTMLSIITKTPSYKRIDSHNIIFCEDCEIVNTYPTLNDDYGI